MLSLCFGQIGNYLLPDQPRIYQSCRLAKEPHSFTGSGSVTSLGEMVPDTTFSITVQCSELLGTPYK